MNIDEVYIHPRSASRRVRDGQSTEVDALTPQEHIQRCIPTVASCCRFWLVECLCACHHSSNKQDVLISVNGGRRRDARGGKPGAFVALPTQEAHKPSHYHL